jgi:DNA polymerase III alpha subunit (gram-positive type)
MPGMDYPCNYCGRLLPSEVLDSHSAGQGYEARVRICPRCKAERRDSNPVTVQTPRGPVSVLVPARRV